MAAGATSSVIPQFEFSTAARIVFGAGSIRGLGLAAAGLGRRALLITGKSARHAAKVEEILSSSEVVCHRFQVASEPTVEDVRQAAASAKLNQCNLVIGLGGGSVMDAAKATAGMLTNEGDLLDYLEVIGGAQPLKHPGAPCLTIPTTAGTGTEVTRNAVLASPQHRFKVSLRSSLILPRLALVDPELTYDLPPSITATSGLDALTQLIEAYVSHRANPLTDGFCLEGLKRAAVSLRTAYQAPSPAARADMAMAALLSGLALANAGLGVIHGFAAPLGGTYSAAHGALCAAVLPWGMRINVRALRERDAENIALVRYTEVARLLTGESSAAAEDGVSWVSDLCNALAVAPLRHLGVRKEDFPALVDKASSASSMKANPILLHREELLEILEKAW